MENKEKLQQLMQDEEFLKKILVLETPEEVQGAFKENGVDISIEDLEKIKELIKKSMNENYELTEEELEEIIGGSVDLLDLIIKPIVTAFFGVLGTAIGKKFFGWLLKD